MDDSPWPAPAETPVDSAGWYLASDGEWYRSDRPPASGHWIASDGRWYPPNALVDPWRWSGWGLGDAWLGVAAYVFSGFVAVAILAAATGTQPTDDLGVAEVSVFVAANAVAFVGVAAWATWRKGLRSLRRDFGLTARWFDPLIGLGVGLVAVVLAGLVGFAVDTVFGTDERTSNVPVDALDGLSEFWVFLVAVAFVTPVIEELFFRGLVFRSFLKRGLSARRAVLSTSLLFVLPHLPAAEGWAEVVSLFASIGVLGLAFTLACRWTGNRLAAPIVAHMVVNGLATVALLANS